MQNKVKDKAQNYNKDFPRVLRTLIKDSGRTQKELATYLNKSSQAISYYCDGSSSPDWETLVSIAKFFAVTTDYLLGCSSVKTLDIDILNACRVTGLSERAIQHLQRAKTLGPYSVKILNDFLGNIYFNWMLGYLQMVGEATAAEAICSSINESSSQNFTSIIKQMLEDEKIPDGIRQELRKIYILQTKMDNDLELIAFQDGVYSPSRIYEYDAVSELHKLIQYIIKEGQSANYVSKYCAPYLND